MLGSLKLRIDFHRPWLKPGPFWSTLAGAVSVAGIPTSLHEWLSLSLAVLLTEGVMSSWWAHLLELAHWDSPGQFEPKEMIPPPPYTLPGSIAAKLWQKANLFANWWERVFWPRKGGSFLALSALTATGLVLGTLLGTRVLVTLAGAVATGLLAALTARMGRNHLPYLSFFAVTFPWLLGCGALAQVEPASLLAALSFGVMKWGMESARKSRAGRVALSSSYAGVVLLLWGVSRPLMSGLVMLAALGTLFLNVLKPTREGDSVGPLYLPGWASMLVCAAALATM